MIWNGLPEGGRERFTRAANCRANNRHAIEHGLAARDGVRGIAGVKWPHAERSQQVEYLIYSLGKSRTSVNQSGEADRKSGMGRDVGLPGSNQNARLPSALGAG